MAVYCQQLVDGEALDPEALVTAADGAPDYVLLQRKAASAEAKDWDVQWLSGTSFVARKVRWDPPALCERVFRIG